jgi:hypothetical protein
MLPLTQHAAVRMQQRGITRTTLESLLEYGVQTYDHHGATIVYFNRKARARLMRDTPRARYRVMEKQLNAYAVVADGEVVTVGHRHRRIARP